MRRTSVRAFLAIPVMALAVTISLSPAAGLQRVLADDAPDNVIEIPGDSRPKDDEPATPEGWREESGKRTYWRDGQMLTGIQTVDGVDYLFGEDGAMTTGWGIDPKTGSWCYADASGALRTGWFQKNGVWYLLGNDHLMLTGWQREGGSTYYLAESGAMQTQWVLVDGGWYWLGSSGVLHTGWAWLGNNWYYLDPAQNGRAVTDGAAQVDGAWYAFDASGHMASSGWALTGGSWYLAEGSGALKTGWQRVNGTWYYLSPADAKMATGDTVVDGKSYHLDDSGAMVASTWVRDATGVWRWYGADGALVAAIDGLDVTFADGSVKSGLTQVGSTWYLMGSSGAMCTGWAWDGSAWYYLESWGGMHTGWLSLNGTWYFLDYDSGYMHTGWTWAGGQYYWFNEDGSLGSVDCTWRDMFQWAQSYYSSTNWLMLTDTSGCRTAIYYGHHGAWRPVKEWICSPGAPATPTVTGEFTVTGKGYSFGNGFTCYYYTQFYGDYLYHSVLYYQNSFRVMDGRLGMHLSHGCVRLDIDNAKWIYDNIPYGTKVVIW